MEWVELMGKIFAVMGALLTAYKLLNEIIFNRKPRLREEYKFTKKFLADIAEAKKPHPLLIEKGFVAVSGKADLTAKEIIFFLAQRSPTQYLKWYSDARDYVEYIDSTNTVKYKGKYIENGKRKFAKLLNVLGYIVFASLALIPFVFSSNIFGKNWQQAFFYSVIFMLSFGPLAIMFLLAQLRIVKGEKLIESLQA